jgi:hypothetical protein
LNYVSNKANHKDQVLTNYYKILEINILLSLCLASLIPNIFNFISCLFIYSLFVISQLIWWKEICSSIMISIKLWKSFKLTEELYLQLYLLFLYMIIKCWTRIKFRIIENKNFYYSHKKEFFYSTVLILIVHGLNMLNNHWSEKEINKIKIKINIILKNNS